MTHPDPTDAGGPSSRRPTAVALGAAAVGLATVLVVLGAWLMLRPEAGGEVHVIEIPAGTGARLDAGEDVTLVPRELEISVNDTVRVVNEDDRTFDVGPFVVLADSTLEHQFERPGRFTGACALHPEDSFTVVVG
ncbi:MAG: hypothetical protein KDB10_05980 [Acidimicrobiales bacterium]|nr:hypothetical protein [Acidimicrobiales bacterium]MCB9373415.1 hypothetical protein [Microthrixaceae bacterium]